MTKLIRIKALSKANGFTVLLLGTVMLVIAFTLMLPNEGTMRFVGYFIVSMSLAGILLGLLKLLEPQYSFTIAEHGIKYHHSRGEWQITWQSIQRVDIPKVPYGWDYRELNYVGIRLKTLTHFLDTISLRLASHLLTEQKHLVAMALREEFSQWQCKDGSCPSGKLYEFSDLTLDGKTYTGLKAMLGHRMLLLREKLGYDVFISNTSLDRTPEQFVQLTRQLKAYEDSVQLTKD